MFVAGFNMPGYLPESDPQEFDDFEDARTFITSELELAEIHQFEIGNETEADKCAKAWEEADEWDDSAGDYWMVFCDGYVYWIERQ